MKKVKIYTNLKKDHSLNTPENLLFLCKKTYSCGFLVERIIHKDHYTETDKICHIGFTIEDIKNEINKTIFTVPTTYVPRKKTWIKYKTFTGLSKKLNEIENLNL
jgi:hypothetical protein